MYIYFYDRDGFCCDYCLFLRIVPIVTHVLSICSLTMVLLWTCGDVFKTLYFFFREAPIQFWICGSVQVGVDVLILLQVYIYKGNTELQRKPMRRGDWVVIICNHEKSDQSPQELEINCDIKTIQLEYFNRNSVIFNETNEELLLNAEEESSVDRNGKSTTSGDSSATDLTETRTKNPANGNVQIVNAEVHDIGAGNLENCKESLSSTFNVNSNEDRDAFASNKRLFLNKNSKKPSKHKVSMLIHRHTLWRFRLDSFLFTYLIVF